jgi:hypothetical protein
VRDAGAEERKKACLPGQQPDGAARRTLMASPATWVGRMRPILCTLQAADHLSTVERWFICLRMVGVIAASETRMS